MKRRGFTLIELLVVVAIIALLIAILLPSLGKARELSQRTTCGTNLKGIMNSMVLYAHDQTGNSYPQIKGTGPGTSLGAAAVAGAATADLEVTAIYTTGTASLMQDMWVLVLSQGVAPKLFICKSDPAPTVAAQVSFGVTYASYWNNGAAGAGGDFAYSYSFAYPWSSAAGTATGGWWKDSTNASIPVASDIAPLNGSGTNPVCATATLNKGANSFTHTRDGQNVAFGDAHVDFARLPNVGQNSDNIFTSGAGTPNATGTAVASSVAPSCGGSVDAFDLVFTPLSSAGNTRQ